MSGGLVKHVILNSMTTLYIDNTEKLLDLVSALSQAEWLAIDTEFMREKTYYPQLCLLQIGTPEVTACIDPLILTDMDILLDLIYDPTKIKVMHSGSQDLEIFYHLRGSLPQPLFDTQIAAPLLGMQEQAGYARLVEEMLGVRLAKVHTRADWSHRPLSDAQIQYAADDVIYLCQLYVALRDKLLEKNRLSWLDSDFSALADPDRYNNVPEKSWRRVKAGQKLHGKALSVLQKLAGWREQTAQQQNRPRGWIIKDDVLIDIARQQPKELNTLNRIRGLNESIVKKHGQQILELIQTAARIPPEPLPDYIKRNKLSADQEALVDLMSALVQLRASENEMNATQLASRKEMQYLIQGETDLDLTKGWRANMVGFELQQLLDGQLTLKVENGKLICTKI